MVRSTTFADLPPLFPQFVESVEVLRPISRDPLHRVKHFPDGRTTMMLRITPGSPESRDSRDGDICVAGPRRYALCKTVAAVPLAVLIRFRRGSAGLFLGSPADDLRDRVIPIEQLWGSEGVRFREAVVLAGGVREMLSEVQAVLTKRARAIGAASQQIAQRAVELHPHLAPRVEQIAARFGGDRTASASGIPFERRCDPKGLLAHRAASAGFAGIAQRYELGTSGGRRRLLRSGA